MRRIVLKLRMEGILEKLIDLSAEGARPQGRISQAKGQNRATTHQEKRSEWTNPLFPVLRFYGCLPACMLPLKLMFAPPAGRFFVLRFRKARIHKNGRRFET
jgi:hypothetical protein